MNAVLDSSTIAAPLTLHVAQEAQVLRKQTREQLSLLVDQPHGWLKPFVTSTCARGVRPRFPGPCSSFYERLFCRSREQRLERGLGRLPPIFAVCRTRP